MAAPGTIGLHGLDDVTLCKHVMTEAGNAFIVFNSFPLIREINK